MTDTAKPFPLAADEPRPPRRRKLVAVAAAALFALFMLSACDPPPPPAATAEIAFVVGARANQANAAPSDPALVDSVNKAVAAHAKVTVVNAGGEPRVVGTLVLANNGENPLLQQRQATANAASLRHLIGSAQVSLPEANTLGAIDVAARAVSDGTGPRTIVVVDSGVTTVGLRVQDGLLANAANAKAATSWLTANDSLPDLRQVNLVWFGLGQTSEPQPPLPISARNRLQALWKNVVSASGGAVHFVGTPITAAAPEPGLPKVTVVTWGDPGSVPLPTLGDAQVGFVQGETALRDPAAARQVIKRLAQLIISGRYHEVWLTGTASSEGQAAANVILSAARARVIAAQLETAAPGLLVHTRGVGSSFPGYVLDRDPDGALNESSARLNRLVIVSATSW
jgi:outer membrane protein OmpA-like peptidoglycan-associated protein